MPLRQRGGGPHGVPAIPQAEGAAGLPRGGTGSPTLCAPLSPPGESLRPPPELQPTIYVLKAWLFEAGLVAPAPRVPGPFVRHSLFPSEPRARGRLSDPGGGGARPGPGSREAPGGAEPWAGLRGQEGGGAAPARGQPRGDAGVPGEAGLRRGLRPGEAGQCALQALMKASGTASGRPYVRREGADVPRDVARIPAGVLSGAGGDAQQSAPGGPPDPARACTPAPGYTRGERGAEAWRGWAGKGEEASAGVPERHEGRGVPAATRCFT